MTTAIQLDAFVQKGASKHHLEIEILAPIARELAQRVGRVGITVSDVRFEAMRRKLLPNRNLRDRSLSYLSAVMRRAGLVPTDRTRRSDIAHGHANLNRVWVHPDHVEDRR